MASLRNGYLCLYRKIDTGTEIKTETQPEYWYHFDEITETKQGFTIYRNGKRPTFIPKWFSNYEYKIKYEI